MFISERNVDEPREVAACGYVHVCVACSPNANAKRQSPLYEDSTSAGKIVQEQQEADGVHAWTVQPGLLRSQIEGWASQAGYQVVWKVSHDYHLQSHATFSGPLVSALSQLFTGLQQRGNSLRVIVYQGNNVILVTEE